MIPIDSDVFHPGRSMPSSVENYETGKVVPDTVKISGALQEHTRHSLSLRELVFLACRKIGGYAKSFHAKALLRPKPSPRRPPKNSDAATNITTTASASTETISHRLSEEILKQIIRIVLPVP